MLLAFLVVVIGIALLIWQPWRSDAAPPAAPSASTPAAEAASTPAPASPAASPTPSPTQATPPPETEPAPTPSPSGTEELPDACTAAAVEVSAVTDKDSYGGDEDPQLSIQLTNTSSESCLINVGTSSQAFSISSGADTWWRSTDCQSEPSDQVVELEAGSTVTSVEPIVWDRTRSAVDTCDTDRAKAPAGYFHLEVEIGGLRSAESKMFRLL